MDFINAGALVVPRMGFGTWRLYGDECRDGVRDALGIGYRYIDTAQRYDNEAAVGEALSRSAVPRADILLSTKIRRDLPVAEIRASVEDSLTKLRSDYIDVLLMHWPNTETPQDPTLAAMLELVDDGMVRAIGVSNFTAGALRELSIRFPIAMNQAEYHPYLAQHALLDAAEDLDQAFVAYSPLARGKVTQDSVLLRIADAHGKTAGQVALRWLIQQPQVAVIPKTADDSRRRENFDIFDFTLSRDEMNDIAGLARGHRIVDPPFSPAWES